MNHLYGITNIQVFVTTDLGELNRFLDEYNGNIIDIQLSDKTYYVIYKMKYDD